MVPSYTCLDQSFIGTPAGHQKIALDHQRIAHRLYSIINQQHVFQQTIVHKANKLQLEQHTNSDKTNVKVYKNFLLSATITQT